MRDELKSKARGSWATYESAWLDRVKNSLAWLITLDMVLIVCLFYEKQKEIVCYGRNG